MGLVQLERLPQFLRRRAEIAARYDRGFADVPAVLTPPQPSPNTDVTNYLYWIQAQQRDELARYLLQQGVYTTFRYWPLHKVKMFGHRGSVLREAERAAETTLNLPCHQALTDGDVDRIVELVASFYAGKV